MTYRKALLDNLPKLLRHGIAGIVDLQVASFASNLLCRVWSTREPPSRVRPPLLDLLDLILEGLLFCVEDRHVGRLDVMWKDGRDGVHHLLQPVRQLDRRRMYNLVYTMELLRDAMQMYKSVDVKEENACQTPETLRLQNHVRGLDQRLFKN